jgi:hypothetical protein
MLEMKLFNLTKSTSASESRRCMYKEISQTLMKR